jgi:hypothetical protein
LPHAFGIGSELFHIRLVHFHDPSL